MADPNWFIFVFCFAYYLIGVLCIYRTMRLCFLLALWLAPPGWVLAELRSDTDYPDHVITGPLHKCPSNKLKVPDGMGGYKCVDKRNKRAASVSPTIPLAFCQSDEVPVAVGKGSYFCAPKKHRIVSDRRKLNYGSRVRRDVFKCAPGKITYHPNGKATCTDKIYRTRFYPTHPVGFCQSDKIPIPIGKGRYKCVNKKMIRGTGLSPNSSLYNCPPDKSKVQDGNGTYMCVPKKHKIYTSDRSELNKGDRIRRDTFNSYPLQKCGPGKTLMFLNGKPTCLENRIKTLLCPTCPVANCPSDKRKVPDGKGGYKCVDKKHKTFISNRKSLNQVYRERRDIFNRDLLHKCAPDNIVMLKNGKVACYGKRHKRGVMCLTCSGKWKCAANQHKVPFGENYKCVDKKQKTSRDDIGALHQERNRKRRALPVVTNLENKCPPGTHNRVKKGKVTCVDTDVKYIAKIAVIGVTDPSCKCPSDKIPFLIPDGNRGHVCTCIPKKN